MSLLSHSMLTNAERRASIYRLDLGNSGSRSSRDLAYKQWHRSLKDSCCVYPIGHDSRTFDFMRPLLNIDSTSILRSQFPNDRARHLVEGPRSSMSHFEGKIERALGRS